MYKKFKKFLNKRLTSGTLSAAMAFNMAAYFPMSVFADLQTDSEKQLIYEENGHKYQLFDNSLSWLDAKEYCENLGGHLVTITTSEEQQIIIDNLLKNGTKDSYYIGLYRNDADDDWKWVTNEDESYFNWAAGEPNYKNEHYVQMYRTKGIIGTWNNTESNVSGSYYYSTSNASFICEWDDTKPSYDISSYVLFSGSDTNNYILNCWKSTFNGDVYTGKNFISNASELYLNGKVNAVDSIAALGWKVNIEERNEHIEKEEMPDWDSRIITMAGDYETSDEEVVMIEDKNVADGALKTTGNVSISGTTFVRDGDGIVHVAGSGNYSYNPSITVPENYLNPNAIDIDSDYFYQKYNDLLTEDGIKMMNVSEETAVELRKLNEAVENTKKLAKDEGEKNPNGNYRFISRGGNEEYSFVSSHGVSNCGEIWSAREAILNGAKFDELDFATYCNNRTSSFNVGDYMPKCKNCHHTFGGV